MKASSCWANNLTLNWTLTPIKVLCDMEGFIKEKQISRKLMYFYGKTERASIRNEVIWSDGHKLNYRMLHISQLVCWFLLDIYLWEPGSSFHCLWKWKSLMLILEEGQRIVLLTIAGEKCRVQSEIFAAFSNIKMSYLVVAFLKHSYPMNISFISKSRKRKNRQNAL